VCNVTCPPNPGCRPGSSQRGLFGPLRNRRRKRQANDFSPLRAMKERCSRREWFSSVLRPWQNRMAKPSATLRDAAVRETAPSSPSHAAVPAAVLNHVAVVQGRFCIALTSFCSVCVERCPVPGAMVSQRGMPTVVPEVCTGCGICFDVCPAPRKAVLMLTKKPIAPVG
jgi:Pyruvate/2-oxoacid:ferredoxin oxidoreductase delta subunit